jgi:gamma-glutamyltranspeptidase/glutathione hydrolase
MRNFHVPGRSPVRATEAMVATSHPLASVAALDLLKEGGNAVDAAICAAAVLSVVEPQSTGIGGDCFALYLPGGQGTAPLAFDGSGRSPAAATLNWYRERGFTTIPPDSAHAVTMPGTVDAWCRLLADHGRTPLERVLAPAIRDAEHGYVVHDRVAVDWRASVNLLKRDPAAALFLPGGRAPDPGDVHRQPALAQTLRQIATAGRDAFYEGEIAADIVAHLRSYGGLHTADDFAAVRGEYVAPIRTGYRGTDIWQLPPGNQGLTALVMLNLLSGFDITALDPLSAERLHLEIECGRLAYWVRDRFIADPAHSPSSPATLLTAAYADGLRRHIDPTRAATHLPPVTMAPADTVYLSIVDNDRNAISFINSTYHSFGCGLVAPKSGVVLQSRGASFRLDPAHPNCLAPSKRPMHTIMPGLATRNGKALLSFGVMGGDYQPFGNIHVLSNMLDYALDPQAAIDLPRVFHSGGMAQVERNLPSTTVAGLQALGHKIEVVGDPLGGGQAILIDWERGTLTGGSDPRKDGCALGF